MKNYIQILKEIIKKSNIIFLIEPFIKLLLFVSRKPNSNVVFKYDVAICAEFKDEAPYLVEWLDYHLKIGVAHFYLYNNNSTDDYYKKLSPYINKEIVTLIDWPEPQSQVKAYKDCIKKYSRESKWIGLIDLDEFVYVKNQDLKSFLEKFRNRPSVFLNWRIYGSSGLIQRDLSKPVTEEFISYNQEFDTTGKVFFNNTFDYYELIKNPNMPIMHVIFGGWKKFGVAIPSVDITDHLTLWTRHKVVSKPPAWINHYSIKSLIEYKSRIEKSDSFFLNNPRNIGLFLNKDKYCSLPERPILYKKNPCNIQSTNNYVPKWFNTGNMSEVTKKCVIYTFISNFTENFESPSFCSENTEYVIVSDKYIYYYNGSWKIKHIENTYTKEYVKTHPIHLFKDKYDYSIFVDSNYLPYGELSNLCSVAKQSYTGIAMHVDSKSDCVYEILNSNMHYYDKLRREGFPSHYGLYDTDIIVTDLQNGNASIFYESWWQYYTSLKSVQDKAILPYSMWKMKLNTDSLGCLGNDVILNPLFTTREIDNAKRN